VFFILAYAPFLLYLPVLLVLGLVFVVVPGGFIIVLGGLYYAGMGLTGLLGLAASQRRQANASRVRQRNARFETPLPFSRSPSHRRGAIAPSPIAVGFSNDRAVGSPGNVRLSRRRSDDVDLVARLDRQRVPAEQDGARAA
jgi:hypothetical protein